MICDVGKDTLVLKMWKLASYTDIDVAQSTVQIKGLIMWLIL